MKCIEMKKTGHISSFRSASPNRKKKIEQNELLTSLLHITQEHNSGLLKTLRENVRRNVSKDRKPDVDTIIRIPEAMSRK